MALHDVDEYKFEPHLEIEVPHETFERALKDAGVDCDIDDVAPYESRDAPTPIENALLDYYAPSFTWRVAEDEDED